MALNEIHGTVIHASRFKQSDLTRAVRGCTKAGLRVGRVEIDIHGTIRVFAAGDERTTCDNSWDDV
jgi:hypothetical protein